MYIILFGLLAAQSVLLGKLFSWKLVGKILGVAAVVIGFEYLWLYAEPWLLFAYVLGLFAIVWPRIKDRLLAKKVNRRCYR